MAFDLKYGAVILEKGGHVGQFEPVFVFRAKDKHLPDVLSYYRKLCESTGSSGNHLANIRVARDTVINWQTKNEAKAPGLACKFRKPNPDE